MHFTETVLEAKKMACSDAEWIARAELACAYRQFYRLGWHELIYNHISLRVPGDPGPLSHQPVWVDVQRGCALESGENRYRRHIIGTSDYRINPLGLSSTAQCIGFATTPTASCITHTTSGMAVAGMEDGLLPVSFPAMFFTDTVAYHEFEGISAR